MEFQLRIPSLWLQSFNNIEKEIFSFPKPVNPLGISPLMNNLLSNIKDYDEININIKPKIGEINYSMNGINGQVKGSFRNEFFSSEVKTNEAKPGEVKIETIPEEKDLKKVERVKKVKRVERVKEIKPQHKLKSKLKPKLKPKLKLKRK